MKRQFFNKTIIAVTAVSVFMLLFLQVGCIGHHAHKSKHGHKHQTNDMTHRFDDIKKWVKIFENPERDKWQKPDEVISNMNIKEGDVVVDIGAGTGYFTRRIALAAGRSGKALGIDIEPSMVKYMKKDARKLGIQNYDARLVKPDDPGLGSLSVDIIFICDTYHHFKNRVLYLKKLSKNLKDGGRIVIVDFYKKESSIGPPVKHKISKDKVIEEFKEAGYRRNRDINFLDYQYFLEFTL